jgi:hypothetical protein
MYKWSNYHIQIRTQPIELQTLNTSFFSQVLLTFIFLNCYISYFKSFYGLGGSNIFLHRGSVKLKRSLETTALFDGFQVSNLHNEWQFCANSGSVVYYYTAVILQLTCVDVTCVTTSRQVCTLPACSPQRVLFSYRATFAMQFQETSSISIDNNSVQSHILWHPAVQITTDNTYDRFVNTISAVGTAVQNDMFRQIRTIFRSSF